MTAALPPSVRVGHPAAALFASDMHLDDAEPALTRHFLAALDARIGAAGRSLPGGVAGAGAAFFLLGDLFEFWVGDDHQPRVAVALANRLEAFKAAGGRVFLMRGNRDFLLDVPLPGAPLARPFSALCGATMLPDPAVVEVAGRRVVLSHGDALCVDDTEYQRWRALCRSPQWQRDFLARPLAERIAMARELRSQSTAAQAMTETLSDVDAGAATELLAAQDANLLVHGHTHRPGRHRWPAGAAMHERWVLGDWAAQPPRGAVLSLAEGLALPVLASG